MASGSVLQHVTFSSFVDVRFWSELSSLKLDGLRLSADPLPFWGSYTTPKKASEAAPSKTTTLSFDGDSLKPSAPTSGWSVRVEGKIRIMNTFENFKETNYTEVLNAAGAEITSAIDDGAAVRDPSLLVRCDALVYADLKSYKHTYWFNFPAILLKAPPTLDSASILNTVWTESQQAQLVTGYQKLVETSNGHILPFFLVSVDKMTSDVAVTTLDAWENGMVDKAGAVFGFLDPSSLPENPGWPLRNFLVLLRRRWGLSSASVLCLRDNLLAPSAPALAASLLISVSIPDQPDDGAGGTVGWEANAKGKLGARRVDLAPFMDPARRAVESADLNLKLMRWRFLPDLEPERLATMKCVLLGAGTLGCNVARSLLAWGFRRLALVDYGRVSYSNPTRQSLFEFSDCADPDAPAEGRPKAQAAAERLGKIVPNSEATAHAISIPMPGHPVAEHNQAGVLADVAALEELVRESDLIFLLTDTRESRWLPTVLAAAHNKLCINVALGFDTFVLLRHGVPDPSAPPPAAASTEPPPCNLGCYFCNDVVAPTDSTRNRTLDQQCTATRPGLSAIASSLAVELAVTLLHHPQGALAPADLAGQVGDEHLGAGLGLVPHQVRGFLSTFSNVIVKGDAFSKCTACSPKVVGGYQREGHAFLLRAFNEPDFLEELSGLKEFLAAADNEAAAWDDDDEPDMPED